MSTGFVTDEGLKNTLQQQGYGVLPSFVSEQQARELEKFFYETVSQSGVKAPFFTTHWSSNKKYREEVSRFVVNLLHRNLDQYFENYKCIFGYYLYKKPSTDTAISKHKDWTLVDEDRYTGYTFWIPLVATNTENGCFGVVPGSHAQNSVPRGTNIPQDYPDVSDADFKPLPVQARDAIIFDHRLLHASPPNLTRADRLAVGLVIVPANAVLKHYYYDPAAGNTTIFEVKDSFLTDTFFDYEKTKANDYIFDIITNPQDNLQVK